MRDGCPPPAPQSPESPESPFGACFARPPRQRRVKAEPAAQPPPPQTAAVTPADAYFGGSCNGQYSDAGSPSGEELRGSQQWSRDTSPTPVEMAEAMRTALPPNDLLNSLLKEMNNSTDPELAAWRSVVNAVNASASAPRHNHDDEGHRYNHSRNRTASIMVPTASMLGSASYETPPLQPLQSRVVSEQRTMTTMTTTKTRAKPKPQPKPKPPQRRASPLNSVGSHAADPMPPKARKSRSQEVTIPAVPMPAPAPTPPLTAKVPTKARTKAKAKAKAKPFVVIDVVDLELTYPQSGVDMPAVEPLALEVYTRKVRFPDSVRFCLRIRGMY